MRRPPRPNLPVVLVLAAVAALLPAAFAQAGGPVHVFLPIISKPTYPDLALVAVADAFIYEGTPESNYGSAGALYAGSDRLDPPEPNTGALRSLVRFTLPSQGGPPVKSATLRVYYLESTAVTGSPPAAVEIRASTGPWAESAVTWGNQPGMSANEYGAMTIRSDDPQGYRDIDITALVQQWSTGAVANDGIYLIGPEPPTPSSTATFYAFLARESAATDKPWPPELILKY